MKKTGTSVDIRTIKNFPIDNPNAKIVKDGLFLRVVEREYYWSKEKQRGLARKISASFGYNCAKNSASV